MKMLARQTIAAAAMLLVIASAQAADAAQPPAADAGHAQVAPAAEGKAEAGADSTADATADSKANADSELITAADRAAEKAANEPNVKHTVIDDRHARIEELRVRGQLQKVTVHPKDGAPGYEIIVGSGSPEQAFSAGQSGSRGSSGKRVWNLLQF